MQYILARPCACQQGIRLTFCHSSEAPLENFSDVYLQKILPLEPGSILVGALGLADFSAAVTHFSWQNIKDPLHGVEAFEYLIEV